ncbi:hypothetical protein [Pontiella sulfatireligans]|uniref:Uncharacterized protein n=1 Tax=Pontiella sulfatireligans TaxID=2750658 RepID=A0A6C2UPI6_9BACT|nr:hypothetical protein [Pontiella sulfatireligans]VGO22202.1 hypothetical protein SCARR_04284 [Pontiella sulfatireligans]
MNGKKLNRKVKRATSAVLAGFCILLIVSSASSWLIWNEYYTGMFKQDIFRAVLLGNIVTSAVGACMVYFAKKF